MQSQRFPLSQALWLALLPLGACSSTGSVDTAPEQVQSVQPAVVQGAPVQPGDVRAVEAQLESDLEDASLGAQDGAEDLQETGGLEGLVESPMLEEVPTTQGRTLDPRVVEVLSSDRFQEAFATSFLSVADVEPTMTQDEREAVLEFQRFMGQEEPDYERAQALLNAERGENTNEMFDFLQGWLLFGQERYEEAIPMLELAVDVNRGGFPKFLRAHKILGFAYMSSDQPAKAAGSLTRVLELGGGDALTFGLLGLAHSAAENFLAAERAFDMAILLDPETENYQLGLVTCYARQRKYQDAIALAQRLIDMHPEDPKFWLLQGNAYIGMQQPGKAAEKFEMASLLGGATPESVSTLADIYANQGLFELSVDNYLRSLELDAQLGPERAIQACELMSYRGALDATKRLVDGVRELRSAELTDKDRVQLLKLESRIAVANGSNEEEVAILEQVVELDPLDGEALLLLGQQAARTDQLAKAIFYYDRAAALDDAKIQADASAFKAYVLVRQQKYKQALGALDFAQSLNKRESISRYIENVKRLDEKR